MTLTLHLGAGGGVDARRPVECGAAAAGDRGEVARVPQDVLGEEGARMDRISRGGAQGSIEVIDISIEFLFS